jgi:hypothetical protein
MKTPNTCLLLPAGVAVLLLFLAVNAGWAGTIGLSRQRITLPANAGEPLFADIDGNGHSDLFVLDPVEKKLLHWRQRPDGFSNAPDQVIPLPPQTAWVALADVDAHPGLELLFSTASGLVYCRQNAGLFESDRRSLIQASQVFASTDFPILARLGTNHAGTNQLIPVISAGHSVLYHRNSSYEWSPGPPLDLDMKQTSWHLDGGLRRDPWHDLWRDTWNLGPNRAHSLSVQQFFLAKPEAKQEEEQDNEGIRKILDDLKKNAAPSPPHLERVDVDGDGQQDLVLWQVSGKLDNLTDVYVFLRGADNKLPERPTQILHCRGFPIPFDPRADYGNAVMDLRGDGTCELVLLEIKTGLASASGVLETALTHGLDWSLTIRSFHHGAFSRSPDASVPVTTILPGEVAREWPIFIQGDFNGDGRPDLLVRGSETRWNILYSTTDGRWFASQPALTFDAPGRGYIEIQDLNGDGLSDIIWHELDQPNLSIFMSPSPPAKSKNP